MIKRHKWFLIVFWSLVLVVILGCVIFFRMIADGKMGFMPTFEELENPRNRFASEVYSEDGLILGKYFRGNENRVYTEYHQIAPNVIEALIATEDSRFYKHSGIDVRGLFRVAWGLVRNDASAGGGSTISQQLAKMLFPREENSSFKELVLRKFREWVIAVNLERSYTKEEIITMYLNKFDFLNLAVGISSAAEVYFSTTPDSLKIEQGALLVGMAKNPSLYNPLRRPEQALHRRNLVINRMYSNEFITKEECDSLKQLPLGIKFKRVDHKEGIAPYFREYLRLYMTAKEPRQEDYQSIREYREDVTRWAEDPLYGWCTKNSKMDGTPYDIYTDGLKIYTPLDSRMQRYAEESVRDHLGQVLQPSFLAEQGDKLYPPFSNDMDSLQVEQVIFSSITRTERYRGLKKAGLDSLQIRERFRDSLEMSIFTWNGQKDTIMSPLDSLLYYKTFFRAGFMAMEPGTGKVKAYVGGPDYRYFMYDMVSVGKRQIGSTIKPILYSLAMQEGLTPCDKVRNVQQTFALDNGVMWTPRNSTSKRAGEMVTLKWGLANSVNNISAWVLKQFTPQAVVKMARKMGIESYIAPVASLFLGSSEVKVSEMVGAFSVFSNRGVYTHPLLVSRIEDKYGNVLAEFSARTEDVMTPKAAYLMINLLQGVVDEGTGIRLRARYHFTMPIAGKTGTTQNHSDGWFIGLIPELTGGVWVGAEDRSIHFQNIAQGQGSNMALPIWANFIKKIQADPTLHLSGSEFECPPGLKLDLDCRDDKTDSSKSSVNKNNNHVEEELFY